MAYIEQKQLFNLKKFVQPNKAVIILGPRRSGKTTLLKKFLEGYGEAYLSVTGDDISVRDYLGSQSLAKLKNFLGEAKLLAIDEAQRIQNIGLNLKLILDNVPDVKIIATGSSAFDMARETGEPLTGRKQTLRLYPLGQMEIQGTENRIESLANLETRLLYGSYPEIVLMSGNAGREAYLREIVSSYLYKDILELDGVHHSNKISSLLRLIAFQIGKEVSYSELGSQLGMSKNTVLRYMDLLEKSFVVLKLGGYSGNLRKEITKSPRYYFYDNGVRNALINNFNPLVLRDDTGELWENYIIIERIKKQEYSRISSNNYFWRTYGGHEIDLVEEREGKLFGYEIKWNFKKIKTPKDWVAHYKNGSFEVIHRENYYEFIT